MIYVLSRGGASLNYKVVGSTTAPSSPQENTIWVDTSVAVTSYVFSAKAPTSPTEGMVWFPSGSTSKAPFNALKKNSLWVFPVACQQYVSNEWVYRTTKTWQDGKWIGWEMYLYNTGNQCTDVTGGWIRYGTGGTVTFNNDNIYLATLEDYSFGAVDTTNAIDLTGFATLKVTASATNRQYMLGQVSVYTKNAAGKETIAASASLDSSSTETVTSLDVSGLSGAYYVRIQSSGRSSSYYITGKVHVTKVELEAAA